MQSSTTTLLAFSFKKCGSKVPSEFSPRHFFPGAIRLTKGEEEEEVLAFQPEASVADFAGRGGGR